MDERNGDYDPTNVLQYARMTFITDNGNHYSVMEDGMFRSRGNSKLYEIELIAGVAPEELVHLDLKPSDEESIVRLGGEIDAVILEHGRKGDKGLVLLVSLLKDKNQNFIKKYLYTSPVKDIVPTKSL